MADVSFFDQANKRLLQLQRSGVFHAAEVEDVNDAERHKLIVWQSTKNGLVFSGELGHHDRHDPQKTPGSISIGDIELRGPIDA